MTRLPSILLCCLLALSACGATAQAAVAAAQYPDLKTLPPRELKLERADVSVEGSGVMHNVLRFSNTAWNAGQGRLAISAHIDPATKEGPAVQRIYAADGSVAEEHTVGRYTYHAAHAHYHFDNWGLYELWTRAGWDSYVAGGRAQPVATTTAGAAPERIGSKTTSCVMDEEFVKTLPGAPWPAAFPSAGCNPNSAGDITQGLSVGWGDTYDYYRFEQWIDLDQRTLTDGDYVLRSVADPDNLMYESPSKADAAREGAPDNEAITPVRIQSGKVVDGAPPSGTVSINDVDAQTASSQVKVKALGRDDVAGVDTVRLSNDGVTWATYSYTGGGSNPMSVAWDVTDGRYGGTSSTGTKTVYAQFRDRGGRWSATETDVIELTTGSPPPPPPPSSPYAAGVLADNAEGFWRLGEASGSSTARDERGAHPGAYRGAPALAAPSLLSSEPANSAVRFDGGDDYVEVSHSTTLSFGSSFSVEAWIKPEALPSAGGFASVLTKREAYSLQFNGPALEFTVVQPGGVRRRLQAPPGAVVAGQRYHVVATYDGSTQRLYLNGREMVSGPLNGVAYASDYPLYIGSWDGTSEFFSGTIDEPAAYNTVLSPGQIKAHYDTATGAAPPVESVPAPSGLTARAASSSAVEVAWTDNSSSEQAFILERSTSADFTAPTSFTLAANATSHRDTGLSAGTTYHYRVKAATETLHSDFSSPASATTESAAAKESAPSSPTAPPGPSSASPPAEPESSDPGPRDSFPSSDPGPSALENLVTIPDPLPDAVLPRPASPRVRLSYRGGRLLLRVLNRPTGVTVVATSYRGRSKKPIGRWRFRKTTLGVRARRFDRVKVEFVVPGGRNVWKVVRPSR
jgi:hypothetical protein